MMIRDLLGRTTILDRAIVLVLAAAAVSLVFFQAGRPPGEKVIVERDGRVVFTAPLAVDRTVRLDGPLGPTTLKIHDGKACVTDSPCPLKICMGMGEVARSGDLVACVPNHLLIRVSGGREKDKEYDLLSR